MKYKQKKMRGFFDETDRHAELSKLNDPLERLSTAIDFEIFRTTLETALKKEAKGPGGCRPYDYVMMFKILILQRYYQLSDDKTEFSILDRLSFMRFLGITISDNVPDAKTIWHFREQLTKAGVIELLFKEFLERLEKKGLVATEGKIVDATIIEVPIQRNKKEENEQIKQGETPKDWEDKPNKLSQKDVDARWTKKRDQKYFGYKDHIKVDAKSKIITSYTVTDASVHDSQETESLLSEKDSGQPFYGDSAYSGATVAEVLKNKKMDNQIHEKGYRDHPLTETQKESNRQKSKIRARVEHVFGFMVNSMGRMYIRCIGKTRARAMIGLTNLIYNLFRSSQIGFACKG